MSCDDPACEHDHGDEEHDHAHHAPGHTAGRSDDAPLPAAGYTGDEDPERLAAELAEATSRMAGQLGWAIGPHRERVAYALAGAPVAVVFERAANNEAQPKHRSGQLAPELLPFLVDATLRTRERLGYADDEDNAYLIPLVLACFYSVESARSGALGLGPATRATTPTVEVLRDDDAMADIRGVPGAAMLRSIAPVESDDGILINAAVQLTWRT